MEGPAVSRARAAALFTTVIFLLSASAAHAHPNFELTEGAARAGDVVGFSISGIDGSATYELEIDDTQVLQGAGDGVVSGTFAVPDLGGAIRTVTVEAEIRGSDKRKKVKRKLDYLGPALPVVGLPAPVLPASVPAAVAPQANPSPEPTHSPSTVSETRSAPAVTAPSRRPPRQSRKRRAVEPTLQVARRGERRRRAHRPHKRRHRDGGAKNTRPERIAPGTVRYFGVFPGPEPSARPGGGGGEHRSPIRKANTRPAAGLAAPDARPSDHGPLAAVVVPGLLALAGFALAGTAVLRRRRLASRPASD
jgi:hypothetical protein